MSALRADGSDRLGLSTRFVLGAGFGGLVAIMALAGFYGLRVLDAIRRTDNQIRREFLLKNHTLNDIRSQLHLSGTYVRDYLLETDPHLAELSRISLEELHAQMDTALEAFHRELGPGQDPAYNELTTGLSGYWQTLDPILKWDAAARRRDGYSFLRVQVLPRRAAVLAMAGRIANINEHQLSAGNDQVDSLLSRFQGRLAVILLAALLLGSGLAAFSMWKILELESQARMRYEEVVDARRQLTELSARLVQAQEKERRSLSRELHDELGQGLSAVLVELRNLSVEPAILADKQSFGHVETVRGLVERSVRVVRNMALLLRPSMLDDLGLVPALKWQAREVSKQSSMEVDVAAELASDDLPDEYKTCIYRVVQEALSNCSRHAQATRVQVRVQQAPHRLSLSIQDDGRGFDVEQTKGLGLLGIEERVARLGGRCEVHSGSGSGTIVAIDLPFSDHEGSRGAGGKENGSDTASG